MVNGRANGAVNIVFMFRHCNMARIKNDPKRNKTGFAGLAISKAPFLNGKSAQSAQDNSKSASCAHGCTAPKLSGAKKIIKHTMADSVNCIHNDSIKFSIFI